MPKTAAAAPRLTAEHALKSFPVGFHFLTATPEQKSRVLNVVGRLVAQEFLPGATALDRDETDRFVVATRSQQLDPRKLRHQFEQLLASRQYHNEHHAEAEGNAAEAEVRESEARVKLEKAQAEHEKEVALLRQARAVLAKVEQAEVALGTQCEVLRPALDHHEQLT